VSGPMGGSQTPDTTATILALTTFRTLKAGYVPWMFQLSWDAESKCTTWQISYEYMPKEEIADWLTSFSMDEFAVQYCAGNGVNTVALIHTGHTCT
jgi:hypothetical protein